MSVTGEMGFDPYAEMGSTIAALENYPGSTIEHLTDGTIRVTLPVPQPMRVVMGCGSTPEEAARKAMVALALAQRKE